MFSKELETLQETSSSESLETGRWHLPVSTPVSSPSNHADICGCVPPFPLNPTETLDQITDFYELSPWPFIREYECLSLSNRVSEAHSIVREDSTIKITDHVNHVPIF